MIFQNFLQELCQYRLYAQYDLTPENVIQTINNVSWERSSNAYSLNDYGDWRDLIEEPLIKLWDELSLESRAILYLQAFSIHAYDDC